MELSSSLKNLVTGDKRIKLFQNVSRTEPISKFTGIVYIFTEISC